jgi:Protein of unknown function (DUF3293)
MSLGRHRVEGLLPAALGAAYARTDYDAAGAVARIGRRSAGVDALLRRLRPGGRRPCGAFVTAWNPRSRLMPRGWNERMLARLRAAAAGLPRAEGWGRAQDPIPWRGLRRAAAGPPGPGWAEHHLLLAADSRRVAVLARRFGQHAIVVVRAGAPARLLPVLPDPSLARPASDVRRASEAGR